MDFGLSPDDIEQIKRVFSTHPAVNKVLVFGSRALGNYKPGSDIDLAIFGEQLSFDETLQIQHELDALGMLYNFDVQRMQSIKDPEVIAHIDRAGQSIYNTLS